MKKQTFTYGNYSYEYFLVRQARRSISLTVDPSLKIVLKCPVDCDQERIQKFLKKKWRWLEKQINYFKKYKKTSRDKEYVSGESFLYLGRQYKLSVKKAKQDSISLKYGRLQLLTTKNVDNKRYNKKLLEDWYFKRTEEIFAKEYRKVLKNFDYDFEPKLSIRKMSRRWGSFLNGKKIILNPKLIQAPKECIGYVITHELCHMKYKNHDKRFYNLLKGKIDNWEEIKERLELRLS